MSLNLSSLMIDVVEIGKLACDAINKVYSGDSFEVEHKADNSPITIADKNSHNILVDKLKELTPEIPILSEEGGDIDYAIRKNWSRYWLIDPLDGTKEFVNKTGEFTVNIALIDNGAPVLGVVMVPDMHQYYCASKGQGAYFGTDKAKLVEIKASQKTSLEDLRVTVSRRHGQGGRLDNLLKNLPNNTLLSCGSTLKICLIARGEADLYPRFGKTCEWDTAAGQCVLEQSGGKLLDLEGNVLVYNSKSSIINPEFVAIGDSSLEASILNIIHATK